MVQTLRVQKYETGDVADQMTYIGGDTDNDDLRLASILDCSTEIGVVLGIISPPLRMTATLQYISVISGGSGP